MLGQGTFGQVAKCICQQTGEIVAVKVIKNQTAFYHQARVEVGVLQYLNKVSDPDDQHHLVRMHSFFVFKEHLCLVFELLNLNLYELIKQNQFRGLSMRLLRIFLSQVSKPALTNQLMSPVVIPGSSRLSKVNIICCALSAMTTACYNSMLIT